MTTEDILLAAFFIGMLWLGVGQAKDMFLARRNALKFEHYNISELFTEAQKRRIAAAAIARNIGQKTMIRNAVLRDIEEE